MTVKEKNIDKVLHCALNSFIENGIEKTKVSDVAEKAGLTERSVFRYFDTKADLVFESLLLFWKILKNKVKEQYDERVDKNTLGSQQIREVLKAYTDLCFDNRKQYVFIHEAETYLYRMGKSKLIENRYVLTAEKSISPLAIAIKNGMEDGSIRTDIDIAMLYYDTFDSLLGLIQKIAVSGRNDEEYIEFSKKRLDCFCDIMADAYCKR